MPKAKIQTDKTTGKAKLATSVDGCITVRHYCQGIGDCHLLSFPKKDGGKFWMLIDCGVHSSVLGGSARIDEIVADIHQQTKRLDVIVMTHEHTDHTSGFVSAKKFSEFEIGEAWMAWTENPKDSQAQQLDKYKQQALTALQLTSRHLDGAMGIGSHLSGLRSGLDALLGFTFGAKGDRVRASRDAIVKLALGRVHYREPGDPPVTLDGVPNLRIYALGPSRDAKFLDITERSSEMYHATSDKGLQIAMSLTSSLAAMGSGSSGSDGMPFDWNAGTRLAPLAASRGNVPSADDEEGKIAAFARDRYFGPARIAGIAPGAAGIDQSWRRIDLDWLGVSADLAMQLDKKTNNTSLVLAFEFIDTGRVLLFAADAQVGSWLGWHEAKWTVDGAKVTGPDLLARTVFYKVGHHGSHNATLKKKGLELMVSKDLSAFIPTNAKDAKKVKWGEMPFEPILKDLAERCQGRVIRADDPWVVGAEKGPAFSVPSGSIKEIDHKDGLWVELQLA